MKRFWTTLLVLALTLAIAIPVGAITKGGELDDGDHPYVGLMVAYEDILIDHDGDAGTPERWLPLWRCSGALVSPTVFVTAGHCTGAESSAPGAATPAFASVWFNSDVDTDNAGQYPWYEEAIPANNAYQGVPYPHPNYVPDAFYLFDLGVVELDGAGFDPGSFASMPWDGYVDDEIGHGRNAGEVTVVGYGLQEIRQNAFGNVVTKLQADRVRYQADVFVVDTNGVAGLGSIFPAYPGSGSMSLSSDAKHGGTCFGDSGGPTLHGDVLVGVTSFGLNQNCTTIGGAYRIDKTFDIAWINSF